MVQDEGSCLQVHYGERVSGNIFIRPSGIMHPGDRMPPHKHNFDHTTILFTGSVRVRLTTPEGEERDRTFHAPDSFLVLAGVVHEITALEEPTVYWCVYAHRTPQGDVVQEYTGWEDAYV